MRLYHQEIEINATLDLVWEYLSNIENFGKFNAYHHGVRFSSEQKQGVGTEFITPHTFWPIFPLPPLDTICKVTHWEKNENQGRIVIAEAPVSKTQTAVPLTQHSQTYTLSTQGKDKTQLVYEITYNGIPDWVPWYAGYVNRKVNNVMIRELQEIKKLLEL